MTMFGKTIAWKRKGEYSTRSQFRLRCMVAKRGPLRKMKKTTILVFEMAALRKILGIHIMDKMRNENIRMALKMTDTIVQKVHES